MMVDSRSRGLSLVSSVIAPANELVAERLVEPGLADVVTLQRRAADLSGGDEQSFFLDTLAEYQWARDVAGLAATTLERLVKPMIEICEHYGLVAWRLTPRQVDSYFAGPGKRGRSTVRQKMNLLEAISRFWSSGTRARSRAASGWAWSRRSIRSTGPGIEVTSGCECRRRSGRRASSSPAGASRWIVPASR
jgi:hypothetical protein